MMKSHVVMLAAAAVLVMGGLMFGWPSGLVVPFLAVGCMAMMMFMMWSMSRPSRDEHTSDQRDHAKTHDQR